MVPEYEESKIGLSLAMQSALAAEGTPTPNNAKEKAKMETYIVTL